jgi:Putative zinc-finger
MDRKLSCAEFEVMLADWIDETLPAAERDGLMRHLETCPACTQLAEDARFAVGFMDRAAEVEVSPLLVSKILHATNEGFEFKLRARGVSGWINRLFAPVLRPRFVMGAMLTLMSLTIMARGCGLPDKTFTAAELDPVRLWTALDNRTHRVWEHAVKSYQSMRLVYEVKTQINVWAEQQRQEDEAAADARADTRKLSTPKIDTPRLDTPKQQPENENRK